ncbi:Uncharacterized protein GBIM_20837 [Gryllus bimaculatus]|nr:Uncharacterized protein GBIM_20837 [Gryllus bimaculatus]
MALWMQAALAPGPPTGAAGCRALGAVLHYAVLASFCWMLAAGFTHYLRLSTGLEVRSSGGPGARRLFKRKLLLCVALVALQGLVWVLAPLAAASLFFAYLFCLSAPLQGVVLFAFFGLGERQVRARVSAWAWTKRAGGAGAGRGLRAASPAYRGSGTTASTSASASASAPDAADAAEALQPLRQAPSPPTSRSRALSLPEINAAPHPRESHL